MRSIPSLLAVALLPALSWGCSETPWPSPADEAMAVQMGAAASDVLTSSLIRNLTAAVDSSGPAGAIDFCSREALSLTAQAAAMSGSVEIKRTSSRVRNPANAPDSLEAAALTYFEERLDADGTLPASWVQAEGDVALRYYRPLVVNDLCVRCHGPVTALSDDVVAALSERYPQDHATGYLPGDFRGLIRVRIPRDALSQEAAGPPTS